jgi:hypothetical protein
MNLNKIPKYVINLPHRTDRLGSFVREIHKTFENKDFTLINGVIKETSRAGIWQAFKNCIQDAKNKNYPYILVMEDDVIFRDNAYKYVEECFNNLPENWDILLGGISGVKELIEYNNYWNKVIDFSGAHFMVMSSNTFDIILDMKERVPHDRILARDNIFNCYVTKKLFAIQAAGFSDCTKKEVDYTDFFNKFELL